MSKSEMVNSEEESILEQISTPFKIGLVLLIISFGIITIAYYQQDLADIDHEYNSSEYKDAEKLSAHLRLLANFLHLGALLIISFSSFKVVLNSNIAPNIRLGFLVIIAVIVAML